MSTTIEAVFKNGTLQPLEPLELDDDERVSITVSRKKDTAPSESRITNGAAYDPQRAYEALLKIAAMPMESEQDGFSGSDHDKILYGGPNGVR